MRMHLATGDIDVQRSRLPEGGVASVDATVRIMAKMAKGEYGSRSAKIRALAINIINAANVADKDYYGMAKAIHEWVRDQIRYIKDPIGDGEDGETLNQETLSYPEETAFNSMAGDCDDKTILEIALLGSLGIQSYPVVIGTQPGRYNHVYLNIILPPGKYPHAGETIPADPIMREWPLGKEAPAAKVKMKKLYTDLSGLSMDLGAYASAPSYLDTQNLSSVGPVLNSSITDTGGRGRIMNVKELTRPSEDLDDMFSRPLVPATQPVQLQSMLNLGPITARREQKLTSYLDVDGARMAPRKGPIRLVEASEHYRHAQPTPKDNGPTVGELCGLADYLSAIENELDECAGFHGVAGAQDPLHKAAAASAYAHSRAHKASQRVNWLMRGAGMFGLGEEQFKDVTKAQHVEAFAHTIAKKANAVAAKGAKTPARKAALAHDYRKLQTIDRAFLAPTTIAKQPRTTDHIHDAAIKVQTLAAVMHDGRVVHWANDTLVDRGARRMPGMPLKTPLNNAVVRDQFGRVIYSSDLAGVSTHRKGPKRSFLAPVTRGIAKIHNLMARRVAVEGLGRFSFKSITKPIQKILPAGAGSQKNILNTAFNPLGPLKLSKDIAQKLANRNKFTAKAFTFAKTAAIPFVGGPMASGHAVNRLFKKGGSGPSSSSAAAGSPPPTTPAVIADPPYADPSYDPNTPVSTDPGYDSNTGMSYQPGMQMPGDPNAQFNYPDPFASQDNGMGPAQSEDFPQDGASAEGPMPGSDFDMSAPGAGGPTAFDPGMDTGPQDSFGPEDVMTSSESDWGSASNADDDTSADDDATEGSAPAPRRHKKRRAAPADDADVDYDDDSGADDTDVDSTLYQRDDQPQGPWGVDGFSVGGASVSTLALLGLGAYLLLKK